MQGISGFGRIGRLVCRAACEKDGAEIVAVNAPFCDVKYAAYLFKYDSTHGIYKGTVACDEAAATLIVDGKPIKFFAVRNANEVPWGEAGADISWGTAPPCAYADAPHGSVRLKDGQLGPLEILKAAEPPLEEAIAKYA